MIRAYCDTDFWVYNLESNVLFGADAQRILREAKAGGHRVLTSHFLLAEVLVGPAKSGDHFTAARYKRLLTGPAFEVVPFGVEVASRFSTIRAAFKTKQADSIHLALAASAKADLFITNDARLHGLSIPGIGQVAGLSYRFP